MTFKRKTFFILALLSLSLGGYSSFNLSQALAQVVSFPPGGNSGGNTSAPICLEEPVQIDLPTESKVEVVGGKPQVILQWGRVDDEDPYWDQKKNAFMSYLETDPRIGMSQNKMKNAFAFYAYHELAKSQDSLVNSKFNEALASTIQGSKALKDRNIQILFKDYYPYLLAQELKKEPELSLAFLEGAKKGLPGETLDFSTFLKNMASSLKEAQVTGKVQDTTSCMTRVIGGSSLEEFKPMAANNVYGRKADEIQEAIDSLKAGGKIEAILESLRNDRQLVAETKVALNIGINNVLEVWKANPNVQNLLSLYQRDPEMRQVVNIFFETGIGSKLDQCALDGYKTTLMDLATEVYLNLLKPQLSTAKTFSEEETAVVLQAVTHLFQEPTQKEAYAAVKTVTENFINDYLTLEEVVNDNAHTGTPFGDYYKKELSRYVDEVEGMQIEIQRDGARIYTVKNPGITQYVDREVPINDTDLIATHQYTLVSKTPCDSREGTSSHVLINPKLKVGTAVTVLVDLEIKLKDSQTKYFMERLGVLLQGLKNGQFQSQNENDIKNAVPKACDHSREELLKTKTSERLFNYVLDCFGDLETTDTLHRQMKDIVNPLIRFLELNQFSDTDRITETFLAPIIELAREDYKVQKEILNEAKALAKNAEPLLAVKSMKDFTEQQKQWIQCGGDVNCAEKIQKMMERYFKNASHSTEVVIEIYDQAGKFIRQTPAHTTLFGEVKQVSVGELKVGVNYQFKVKLKDEPYALAKVSSIMIENALPIANNKYEATVDLKSSSPFFFGNFDNTNDVIDAKDIEGWGQLISQDPAKWSAYNVDGFKGVDLFDANQIQTHWGSQAEQTINDDKLSTWSLSKIFGSTGGSEERIYAPEWLLMLSGNW